MQNIAVMLDDNGPTGLLKPTLGIIHAMGEFVDDGDKVLPAWDFISERGWSAHSYILPSGVVVRQRDAAEMAYHAKGFNRKSFGIEFLVPGVHTWGSFVRAIEHPYLTDIAWQRGIEETAWFLDFHELPTTALTRHSDVDPERKVDPGNGFPFSKFISAVQSYRGEY